MVIFQYDKASGTKKRAVNMPLSVKVNYLLSIVRKRRLSGIAKVRAERRRQTQSAVQLHNRSIVTSTVNGDSSPTESPSKMLRATKDESELALGNSR